MSISSPARLQASETSRSRTLLGRLDDVLARPASSPAALAQAVLEAALEVLPGAGGVLVLMHPQTGLFWTGAVTTLPAESCHPFFTAEVRAESDHGFRRLASTSSPARALRRHVPDSDPLVEAMLEPFGFSDELRVVCRDAGVAWGGLSLWRRTGHYTEADERLLDAAADRIGQALRASVIESLDTVRPSPRRGVLVVEDGRVLEASAEGTEFLRELAEPQLDAYHHLEHLLALAARDPGFSAMLSTEEGRWLSAHGTELSPGRVAITVAAASPSDLFGARVAGAGLSAREVEVTRLLCRGLADGEISRELGISTHTARDHVKAVRRKLGVRSRAEVAALVFAEHYLEDFLSSAAISHG